MSLTEKKCFEVAIALVKQHHKEDLLNAFQKILEELFSDDQIDIYTVNNGLLLDSESISHKESLYRSIASRKTVFVLDDNLFIYPIVSLGKVTHIISLQGDSVSKKPCLLEQLITLFSQQQILLDNNNHDALTGLLNRQSFEKRIASVIDDRRRRDAEKPPACCFAIFDIDFFKKVNDNFGHLYGDEVLILFANLMEKIFRHDDMLFRYGGEEFAVFLKNIDLDTAVVVLERFRHNIEQYDFPQVETITVSIGVTEFNIGSSRAEIISRADQALYYSKDNGRNQVHSFEALISAGKLIDNPPDINDIEIF
ncbi:MAG: GGDEF domain-containing protein [Sulfuriflexus sp.]|nr:GGDEF domain-containing protein [Sulfuriflexus sp.]